MNQAIVADRIAFPDGVRPGCLILEEGKIREIHPHLPEGTRVRVELSPDDWMREWDTLVRQISEASRGQPSDVQLLSEMRR